MMMTKLLSATALASAAFALPVAAWAQTTNQETEEQSIEQGQEAEEGGAIVVTGSRISRPNIDTPIPVTSVNLEELTETGNLSLGDALNQLPSLRSTYSQANSTRFIGTAGLNLIDLRGLGVARTLVLVNGRRHVASTPGSFQVDINTIPTELVERVDVVTGGNSAIYGSDAVAGAVNFIMKEDYDGIAARAQIGVSDRGDRGSQYVSLIAGRNFAEGRGNLTFAAEYARSETLLFNDRNDQTGAFTGVPGWFQTSNTLGEAPAGNGIPDRSLFNPFPGNTFNIISLGGAVQTVCPLADPTNPLITRQRELTCTGQLAPTGGRLSNNYHFGPDGSLVRDNPVYDLRNVGGGVFGGLSASGVEGAMLLPGLERYSFNAMGKFEISSAFIPFFEAKYVNITANQTSTQPTFVNSNLSPVFYLDNPYLSAQARSTIQAITGTTSNTAAFTMFRFNNDIGTRAEDHERETFRIVGGVRGDISSVGNVRYEASLNYGRTETYYETGGNVNIANFNRASNAARAADGSIVCRVNIDSNPNNDDPNCRPINLFGQGAPLTTPDGLAYVLYTSWREQWAEQLNGVAFVSGDTSGFLTLPGGPISAALGVEYRREDAFSDYDDITQSGQTFLNGFATFDPPAIETREAFGELRIPLVADAPFFHELSVEGAARVSDYSALEDTVWAWNVGAVWAPVRDLRIRAGYARSVRAPDLSDLYSTRAQTFANNLVDPCSQTVINQNPNRARNCAAAGVPTTITLPDGSVQPWVNTATSGLSGFNQGNLGLQPEKGKSFTVGAVVQPRWVPGLTVTVDYYNIEIEQAINSLTGQAIINRCYDDPVGLDNPFCDVVFRRGGGNANPLFDYTFAGQAGRRFAGFTDFTLSSADAPGFISQPFNFAKLKTSGIDVDAVYTRQIGDVRLNLRAIVSWLENREQFTYITDPERSDRLHGVVGDPEWRGSARVNAAWRDFDVSYNIDYVGKQTIDSWEVQNSHQGRPPQDADRYPVVYYPEQWYHNFQLGVKAAENFRFYVGVDNVFDTLPPFFATGTGAATSIFPVTGRYFYSGARVTF